jgi:hypothetical protein
MKSGEDNNDTGYYVDANEYLIAALPDESPIAEEDVDDSFINTANQIGDAVDGWLRKGRKS